LTSGVKVGILVYVPTERSDAKRCEARGNGSAKVVKSRKTS